MLRKTHGSDGLVRFRKYPLKTDEVNLVGEYRRGILLDSPSVISVGYGETNYLQCKKQSPGSIVRLVFSPADRTTG
ncbi:hypothetical protein Desti_0379 [Desulfomonile tiedjei DSM 6799]|uniref:Uncharacterized protein n=1 Tax=Desulfomonile tiedjei (strain ATCC 49306 / DSM 6799 / DCB-1) TaxID=706587 RepID=I4C0M5_DESTA|nr:hypothetical protein Desti_0379 [Desulfomonile tiedjei DSM 6799]